MEWLKKISEVNPDFKVLTFTSTNCEKIFITPSARYSSEPLHLAPLVACVRSSLPTASATVLTHGALATRAAPPTKSAITDEESIG